MTRDTCAGCRRNLTKFSARIRAIIDDPTVYHTMNGPTEFHVIGTMKDWTIESRLHAIIAPTLLVSGGFDEATPLCVQPFADHIPDVRWKIFEQSQPHAACRGTGGVPCGRRRVPRRGLTAS